MFKKDTQYIQEGVGEYWLLLTHKFGRVGGTGIQTLLEQQKEVTTIRRTSVL